MHIRIFFVLFFCLGLEFLVLSTFDSLANSMRFVARQTKDIGIGKVMQKENGNGIWNWNYFNCFLPLRAIFYLFLLLVLINPWFLIK